MLCHILKTPLHFDRNKLKAAEFIVFAVGSKFLHVDPVKASFPSNIQISNVIATTGCLKIRFLFVSKNCEKLK